jgi:sugar lactone lactonase YvrE
MAWKRRQYIAIHEALDMLFKPSDCGRHLQYMDTMNFHERSRKLLLPVLSLLFFTLPLSRALAHPGVGIVRDRQGNVFYTDLHHVWRITPSGHKSVVVRDVHTHELDIDSLGNIYGEDNRYLGSGEGDDRYRHRIWRRSPDGRITNIVPWRMGFWREYGFVRDRAGAMYWIKCPGRRCTIYRRAATSAGAGARTTIVAGPGQFARPINWMAASATDAGVLFVVHGPDLRRVDSSGRVTTVTRNLGEHLMGLWPTADNAVYVAVYGARAIVRVQLADGRVSTVVRSPAPWAPSGVVVAPDGHLWVLEYSTSSAARVRRIAPDGTARVF